MAYTEWFQIDEYFGIYLTKDEAAALEEGGVWVEVEGDFGIYLTKEEAKSISQD
ncbi:hypothetical protein [Synechococcus sp. PCC 6312]|uniref:hypothetical protein n=1 Tax=Synechococcus sp. (strain ATCC 27167 / PCC 6312) TaxID=195253 RepID=UPI0012E9A4F8|nr:hypothetical protein [Synechococcus sp. PCC 6312]